MDKENMTETTDSEPSEMSGQLEFERRILKMVEDYHAGRLRTYSLDEMSALCGLD